MGATTQARAVFLAPTPVPTTYKGVVVPDHVRRMWGEALGRIWRRAVDTTREAVASEIKAACRTLPEGGDWLAGMYDAHNVAKGEK
ncbi:hypothetical protein [Streptomyces sp. NPDC048157]|uniref:hypothetical protein n=1 Tax=Streptomyces sp. NPDC048157 TaxID=3365503 RepID=UPI00372359B2